MPDTPETLDALRDWFAERAGYVKQQVPNYTGFGPPCSYAWFKNGEPDANYWNNYRPHPIPATLDAAASAMPEGWRWTCCSQLWHAIPHEGKPHKHITVPRTGDEIRDRFALAKACRLAHDAQKGAKP